ncbi:phage major capsid protein, partial [Mycobacterium avium]|uniref:phage major capsid protein n=1 Tax=Mycobacterium avium TaxID=1764 RepID=UPI001F2C80ED
TPRDGSITNYDFLLDAVNAVRANNFEPNAHIVAPRAVNSLRKLKDSQNRYCSHQLTRCRCWRPTKSR